MRILGLSVMAVLMAAACGGMKSVPPGDDDTPPDAGDMPPANGFRLTSPDITIDPNTEVTYCWYFRTSNTTPVNVNKWHSEMTPGSHHMIMFLTNGDAMPVGTLSTQNCGIGASGSNLPIWTYAAAQPTNEIALPTDDGAGKPLAQTVAANQAGFFQMHYLNASDNTLTVHVQLDAFGMDPGAQFTQTDAFITFNGNINIPAMTDNVLATATVPTPAGAKFWLMSTHSHKQSVMTDVKDGTAAGNVMYMDTDWEHPHGQIMATPFFQFASNQLTYECTYDNPTNRTIRTGDSAQTDEMCMATGYYFPSSGPKFCFNSTCF